MPSDSNHNGTQQTQGDPGHSVAWDGDLSTVPLPGLPDHTGGIEMRSAVGKCLSRARFHNPRSHPLTS